MPHFTTSDGTELYYTDQGAGKPVLLSHGWPLSSDAWQVEIKVLVDAGYRAIAHDRRGHGRSAKTSTGNDMDTYARDLAELVAHLDLQDLVVIGHSTGGGEVVRYAAQHGVGRVRKVVTAGAVPPVMVASETNPDGVPREVFDGIRAGVLADASQFYIDLSDAFFGANREGSVVSEGAKRDFWRQGLLGDRLLGGPEGARRADPPGARRRRPDRADRQRVAEVRRARQARHREGLRGRAARHLRRVPGAARPGHPRVHRGLTSAPRTTRGRRRPPTAAPAASTGPRSPSARPRARRTRAGPRP
jgi:pimeloyl-ACP methyl ester carboxylesterase